MSKALVLNITDEPLSVVSGYRAAILVYDGKADVVESSDEVIRSERLTLDVPTVVRLRCFVRIRYERLVPSAAAESSPAIIIYASIAVPRLTASTTSGRAAEAGSTHGRMSWRLADYAIRARRTGCLLRSASSCIAGQLRLRGFLGCFRWLRMCRMLGGLTCGRGCCRHLSAALLLK